MPLLIAALAMPASASAWDGEPPPPLAFTAMAEGRFAAVYPQPGALLIRFAQGQFRAEDTAEVDFGYGYPQLMYDPDSDTLLLYRGYEDSGYLIASAPEGRELYRLRTGESGEAVTVVPGAGLLAIGDRGDLSLVECRTGVTRPSGGADRSARLDRFGHGAGRRPVAGALRGRHQQLYVMLDWRAGHVLWRQPAEPYDWGGRGRVAADSTRIFTLTVRGGSDIATITSRSRSDGALLGAADLHGDWCWIFAVPGESRLLYVSGSHDKEARLQLLDPITLAPTAAADWPAGLRVHGMRSVRPLGDGRILLDGTFAPSPGPRAHSRRTCHQLLLDAGSEPPRVRSFDDLVAVDPAGNGWRVGTRRREVVGEVPWLEPVDLDAAATDLPVGVRGYRQEIATGIGPGPRVVSVMRQTEPTDIAALHRLMDGADLCFTGTLAATTTHCLGLNGRPDGGVIEADFTVDQLLWGPDVAARVYIDGFNLPGCVTFDPPKRLPPERFVPGRRYLVIARWLDDAFVVHGPGLFAMDPDAPTFDRQCGFTVPDLDAAARAFAARIDLASQFERADVVVRLGTVEPRSVSIAGLVTQVYKGDDALCRVEVWAEPGGFGELRHLVSGSSSGNADDDDPVLFLKQCGDDRYELLEGSWSVLRRRSSGDWARPGGLREPRAGSVLDNP
ncbi:MAG: hypothetical protein IPI48_00020 [bacterium]|nr:hypothetical protein [bacterium]